MGLIHTPKEDGGWKNWLIREIKVIPSALINLFAAIGIIVIVFFGR